jgi:hypothetical protein
MQNFENLSPEDQRLAIQTFRDTFGPLLGRLEPALAMCVPIFVSEHGGGEIGKRPTEEQVNKALAVVQQHITKITRILEELNMGPIETIIVSGSILKIAVDYLAATATRTVRENGLDWNAMGNDQTH